MARKPYPEEPEQHDRWLVSYADFITLLFALFVVMYAMASMSGTQFSQLSASLGAALGRKVLEPAPQIISEATPVLLPVTFLEGPVSKGLYEGSSLFLYPRFTVAPEEESTPIPVFEPVVVPVPPPMSADEVRQQLELRNEKLQLKHISDQLEQRFAKLIEEGKVRVTQTKWGVSIEVNASILFAPADVLSNLTPESEDILRSIAEILKDQSQMIHVEGHTDDQPIQTSQYPSNWELSSSRAGSVVRLFVDMGLHSSRLVAIGYAANKPVDSNSTPEGRQRNRRVQIMIIAGSGESEEKAGKVEYTGTVEYTEALLP